MERRIDFWPERHMLCGGCEHRFVVDLDWIDRWEQGGEECPGCGLTCDHEDAPRATVDADEAALDDGHVAQLAWYHTSTCPEWPTRDFDPAANLTSETRERMGGGERVAAWVASQRAKALHVGTYEAAVHNMLRRMDHQADSLSQFHLYRVRLRPDVVVRKGWLADPSDWLGDVMLADVCPTGIDVARYLNYHEDPGRLSLALGRSAIVSVQQIAIPLPDAWDGSWVREAIAALESVSDMPIPATGKLARFTPPSSPRVTKGRELGRRLAGRLPVNLRHQFESAMLLENGADPLLWARRASSVCGLIVDPQRVLAALDAAEPRVV